MYDEIQVFCAYFCMCSLCLLVRVHVFISSYTFTLVTVTMTVSVTASQSMEILLGPEGLRADIEYAFAIPWRTQKTGQESCQVYIEATGQNPIPRYRDPSADYCNNQPLVIMHVVQ